VARFATRFAPLGFEIVPETMDLMRLMVASGEVDTLVPERVWGEFERALNEPRPSHFVTVLRECGALVHIMPELDRIFGVPQPPRHHPEVDTGIHALLAVDAAAVLTPESAVRFAALVHDLGKGLTPREAWPRHIGHEARSVELIAEMCQRLRAPHEFRDLAVLAARYHTLCHQGPSLRASTLFKLLEGTDALRRPTRFLQLLLACEADFRGRTGNESHPYPQRQLLSDARAAACGVDVRPLLSAGLSGERLAAALRLERIAAIRLRTGAR
jgi:tRNA nucleotidyltransferase (CCA-adding enzyme)